MQDKSIVIILAILWLGFCSIILIVGGVVLLVWGVFEMSEITSLPWYTLLEDLGMAVWKIFPPKLAEAFVVQIDVIPPSWLAYSYLLFFVNLLFIAVGVFMFKIVLELGRNREWARIVAAVLYAIAGMYSLSFTMLMQGGRFASLYLLIGMTVTLVNLAMAMSIFRLSVLRLKG